MIPAGWCRKCGSAVLLIDRAVYLRQVGSHQRVVLRDLAVDPEPVGTGTVTRDDLGHWVVHLRPSGIPADAVRYRLHECTSAPVVAAPVVVLPDGHRDITEPLHGPDGAS